MSHLTKIKQLCHVCRTDECGHGLTEACGHWVPWSREGVHLNTCLIWQAHCDANPELVATEGF